MSGPKRVDLRAAAREAMVGAGFEIELDAEARRQLDSLESGGRRALDAAGARDLRGLIWSSIDNVESRDLDQVEVAEQLPDGVIRVRVGIADVDSLLRRDSPLDRHAAANTTSVYTGVSIFPMLPEEISTGLTSLNEGEERLAIVIELVVTAEGVVSSHDVFRAVLVNRAQLDYDSVGRWLEGSTEAPAKVAASPGLQAQLRLQDSAARALRRERVALGALELETIEATPVATDGIITELRVTRKSPARDLIEDFMIAANVAMAQFLEQKGSSSVRRVVKAPERWGRIVALAAEMGESLPQEPDSGALARFLSKRRAADPDHFPDLSLSIVKLMGPGEYVLDRAGEESVGHFGLAAEDYSHTTAPNRRFADLVMQRLLKAVETGAAVAYSDDELDAIATRCTRMEDAARKVERLIRKKSAAQLLGDRIGQAFDAIVTGASEKGTYVRTLAPPVEGKVVRGAAGMDVGDKVRVTLVRADAEKGYIDFAR
ncbi:MAG: RNB domain-containing ribonuclease [Gemmatimonadota bacterium]|nr:RNB domain-containing ribonuclease [Gemmatimonadota bacterium]